MRNGPYTLVVAPDGYPGKLYRGRYAYEHHVVVWLYCGRTLRSGEVVHHLNGDKRDNRVENLEIMAAGSHKAHHANHRRLACGRLGKAAPC